MESQQSFFSSKDCSGQLRQLHKMATKACARVRPSLQIRYHQNGRGPAITTGSTSLQFWRLAKCVSMNLRSLVS
jgi:hypothetical protein